MSNIDARGYAFSGAVSATAFDAYEDALATALSWRDGAEPRLALALQEAPDFVMAYFLRAYLLICSRDPSRIRSAQPLFDRVAELPANERERMHFAAIAAAFADDYELAKTRLGELLRSYPRDALALQVAHAFDHLTGDVERMELRVAGVLPAWSSDLSGYHAVLAMHAFGLNECGEYGLAEQTARAALALDASNARAHHVMAHVFEMTGRADAGVRWMGENIDCWGTGTVVDTHCWWHLALFHLAQGRANCALGLYDRCIRADRSGKIADLIDASALLWRIQLHGGETAARWSELADAWEPHIGDGFCSFNDLHAMLAFVGADDWERARRLELALVTHQSQPTRYGATTRQIGLPACRALMALGRGNDVLAITLLASLPQLAHRLGGSHAQRDVLSLTLQYAMERQCLPDLASFSKNGSQRSAPAHHIFQKQTSATGREQAAAGRHFA